MTETSARIVAIIKTIPPGRVAGYGQIAAAAGLPNGARMTVRILHSLSRSENLPWHRVVKADGRLAFPPGPAFDLQKALLEAEGVTVPEDGRIDRSRFAELRGAE